MSKNNASIPTPQAFTVNPLVKTLHKNKNSNMYSITSTPSTRISGANKRATASLLICKIKKRTENIQGNLSKKKKKSKKKYRLP